MKIAFVTGSLEPGRDGVGDYTTLLASECARQGHAVARLALNDQHARDATREPAVLRLPAACGWPGRIAEARAWLEDFAPDCVSLQFVCYGFHPRGFVGPHLGALLRGWPLHVFMHELWMGSQIGAPWKHRLLGWLQRRRVLALLRAPSVRCIHTSNDTYVHLLARAGVPSVRLPLFGSLPLPSPGLVSPDDALVFALFGTLHPEWPSEPLFSALRKTGRPITIAHAGNIGEGAALWERLTRDYAAAFTFRRLGELPPQDVADFFATSHFAIATTPWPILGKSASAAAMLEAGLPVIVNRDDVRFAGLGPLPTDDPLLIRMDTDLPMRLLTAHRREPRLRLPEITARFLAALA